MKSKVTKISLVAVIMLVFMISMCVFASADDEIFYGEAEVKLYGTATTEAVVPAADIDESALEYLIKGCRDGVNEINFYNAGYRVPLSKLYALQQARVYAAPDAFYVDSSYGYRYITSGNNVYVYSVVPQYIYTGDELTEVKAEYESMISHIVDQAKGISTDLGRALYFHEYIVSQYEYDTDYGIYDAYSMLKQKKGVCQAYTLLYSELLNRVGIDNTAVLSDGLNHVWNALEIGGEWFLADLTWDDPIYDEPGRVYHSYFLSSKETFGHTLANYTYDWVVTDGRMLTYSNRYDSTFWRYYEGWIHSYEDYIYHKESNGNTTYVCRRDADDIDSFEYIFSIKSRLYVGGDHYWFESGLGFCGAGDKIYYAVSTTHTRAYVYEYDLDDGSTRAVYTYTHSCSVDYCYIGILSLMSDGDKVYFRSGSAYSDEDTYVGSFDIEKPLLMDVNCDGSITNADISVYLRFLSGWNGLTFSMENADVDKNGKCNNRDLVAIIRHING